MIKKSFLFMLLSVLLAAIVFSAGAQEQEPGQYEGTYRFSYPTDFTLTEGNDFVKLETDENTITVYGPDSYNRILGAQTFDNNDEALEFFVDRAGLEPGEAISEDLGDNQLSAIEVELRNQSGRAVLVDLDNGRKGVVVFLADEGSEVDEAAQEEILGSLEFPPDLVDVAMSNPDFTTLVAAAQAAGVVETLRDGEYTVFAPTNEAFERALAQLNMTAEEVMADTETLAQILQYHVVEGVIPSSELTTGWLPTLSGDEINVLINRGNLRVNNSNVIMRDVEAANGVIHVIDRVLLPPELEAARLMEQFPTTLRRTVDQAGPFTFKYPTGAIVNEGTGTVTLRSGRAAVTVYGPEAFNNLIGDNEIEGDAERLAFFLDRLNAYEVGEAVDPLPENAAAGVRVTVPRFDQAGEAYLVDLDNNRTGVVISLAQRDGYSLAYSDYVANLAVSTLAYPPDVVDVAAGNPEFSTLVSAIEAAGLTDTLRDSTASYTIFAPANAAFTTYLANTGMSVDDLVANPAMLADVLNYHVVPTATMSTDFVAGPLETVNTYPLTVAVTDGAISVNGANVTQADIEASNGVIHVIDSVLMPPLCFATTESEALGIYVGPSEDRAIVVYFPRETRIPVTGQFTDEAGTVWYMLDKDVAAPGKQANETWTLASEVTVTGSGCETLETIEMAAAEQ